MASHPYSQQQQQKAVQQRAPSQTYVRPILTQSQYHLPWPPHHHGQSMGMCPNPQNTNGQIMFSNPPMAMPPGVLYQPQISLQPGAFPPQRPTQPYFTNPSVRLMTHQYPPYSFYHGQQHGQPYYYPANNQPLNTTPSVPTPCMSPQSGAPRVMNSLGTIPTGPMGPTVTPPGIVQQPQPPDIRSQPHQSIPRPSCAIPIVDPKTQRQIIISQELFETDTSSKVNEKKSQPSKTTNGSAIAEEFARRVSDAARSTVTTENKDSLSNLAISKDTVIVPIQEELQLEVQCVVADTIVPDNIIDDQCDLKFGSIEQLDTITLEIQNSTENTNENHILSLVDEPQESSPILCDVPKNLESVPTDVTEKPKVPQHTQRSAVKNQSNRQSKQSRSKASSRSKESIIKEVSSPSSYGHQSKQEDDLSPSRQDVHLIASIDTVKIIEPLHIAGKESSSVCAFNDSNDTNNNSESKNKIAKQNLTDSVIEPLHLNIDKSVINTSQIFSEVSFAQKSLITIPPFGSVSNFADTNKNIVSETQTPTNVKLSLEVEKSTNRDLPRLRAELDEEYIIKKPSSAIENDRVQQSDNDNDRTSDTSKAFFDPNFNVRTEILNSEHRIHTSKTVDETDRSNPSELTKPSFLENKVNSLKFDNSFFPNRPNSSQTQTNVITRNDFSMKFQTNIAPLIKPDVNKLESAQNDVKSHDNIVNVVNVPRLPEQKTIAPLNTSMSNGMKRKYDKDFLFSLRSHPNSICEPNISGFEGIDSVLKQKKNLNSFGGLSKQSESILSGGKSISQRGSLPKRMSQPGKPSSGGGSMSSMKPGVIHVSLSLHEDVKLNEAENAWKPSCMKKSMYTSKEIEASDTLLKQVRGILNKITPQKYDALIKKIKLLDIDTLEKLEGVIDLVWEKAVYEPNFATFYAQMCKDLKTIAVDNNGQKNSFAVMIISKCQREFEMERKSEDSEERQSALKSIKECTEPEKKAELLAALEEEDRKMRMRSVGNIRFIGELYILNLLTEFIMMKCIEKLLKSEEEETLECLCKLLTTIGAVLETTNKLTVQFDKMQSIVNRRDSKISSRVRFMLRDVIELRNNKWVPRRTEAKPKTMDQIKQEADSEHFQTQVMNSGPMGSRKDDKQSGGRRNRGGSSNRSEDEWILNQSRARISIDSQKLNKLKPLNNMSEVKLGPSYIPWGKGSVVKSAASRSMGESFAPTSFSSTNIFNSLKTESDPVPYMQAKNVLKDSNTSRGGSIEGVTDKNRYSVGSRSDSQRSSRSNSSSRSEDRKQTRESTPQVVTASSLTELTEVTSEQIQKICKQVHSCMEEYFEGLINHTAVIEELKEKFSLSDMLLVLEEILNIALDKSVSKLHMMAREVTIQMIETQLITPEQYFECMSSKILPIAPENLLDVPKIYQYLSILLAPHIKNGQSFVWLYRGSNNIIEARQGGAFLGHVLKTLVSESGQSFVHTAWKDSNLELFLWMPSSEVNEFMKSNDLTFLTDRHTPDEMLETVFQLMQENHTQIDIEKWIDQNIGEAISESSYLKALAKAICKDALMPPGEAFESRPRFCTKSSERLNNYMELLNKHIQRNQEKQLQCLLAIQQLIHAFEHPQGVTLQLFNHLLDTDVICVDAFLEWEQNSDPHEQEGRGVMIMSLNSFFTIIKETSSEQYDDSCEED